MKLTQLLERLEYEVVQGDDQIEVTELINDSRKVSEGSVFVCISGAVSDGHTYIEQVAEKGAAAVIVEKDVEAPEGLTVIKVKDTRYALAMTSAAYFGYPAEKLKVIGITGTKGKTTTTYMVKSILEEVGIRVGLIGTIEAIIGDKSIPANNTTPESYTIQKYFAEMVEAGCECVVMEVSSQGLTVQPAFRLRSESLRTLAKITSDRTNTKTLTSISIARACCLNRARSESAMWMINGSKTFSKMRHAKLRHSDFLIKQISVPQM